MSRAPNCEVLVCGVAPAAQLGKRMALLAEPVSICAAHTPEAVRSEIARGRHPVCIIEHRVWATDPTADLARLMAIPDDVAADDDAVAALTTAYAAKLRSADSGETAHGLLPSLIALSPETKFVITCHPRYMGATTTLRALYKDRPEVIKVIGSLAEWRNVTYLLKLISKTHLGKTWTPKPVS